MDFIFRTFDNINCLLEKINNKINFIISIPNNSTISFSNYDLIQDYSIFSHKQPLHFIIDLKIFSQCFINEIYRELRKIDVKISEIFHYEKLFDKKTKSLILQSPSKFVCATSQLLSLPEYFKRCLKKNYTDYHQLLKDVNKYFFIDFGYTTYSRNLIQSPFVLYESIEFSNLNKILIDKFKSNNISLVTKLSPIQIFSFGYLKGTQSALNKIIDEIFNNIRFIPKIFAESLYELIKGEKNGKG